MSGSRSSDNDSSRVWESRSTSCTERSEVSELNGNMENQGWVPPEERDADQLKLHNEFLEEVGHFGDVGSTVDEPERVIMAELETKYFGKPVLRVWQVTGSCVGAGGAQAYIRSMVGDVVHRGDNEEVKLPFPYATYGVGRQIGGMRRTGSGSFGAAQAKAVKPENFGMLAWDDSRVPKPTVRNGWAKWTQREELTWSHPSAWPMRKDDLHTDARKYGMHTVTAIRDTGQWVQLLAQGYGVTLASSFGTRPRVQGDVLLGPWNGSWAHQMSSSGYWKHPQHGLIFLIDNQWGPSAHGDCPTLSKLGVRGSFWIKERDASRIIRSGEVFGHSSTGGFPARKFEWNLARYED